MLHKSHVIFDKAEAKERDEVMHSIKKALSKLDFYSITEEGKKPLCGFPD